MAKKGIITELNEETGEWEPVDDLDQTDAVIDSLLDDMEGNTDEQESED